MKVPAIIAMLVLAGLGGSKEQAPPSTAQATPAQGFTLELENQWVRVLRLKLAPHATTGRHQHPESIVVFLTEGVIGKSTTDGRRGRQIHRAGDVLAMLDDNGQGHIDENLSDQPLEAIVVELKPGAPSSAPVTLDPVRLDPEHHPVVTEGRRVRVIRTILEPHLKSPMHEHPHYVVVYLTELHTTMRLGDGRLVDNPRRPGEVAWRDALKHETENIGEKTAVEIQIELK
jgi:quercetin dioxygenase-like cupin family protein